MVYIEKTEFEEDMVREVEHFRFQDPGIWRFHHGGWVPLRYSDNRLKKDLIEAQEKDVFNCPSLHGHIEYKVLTPEEMAIILWSEKCTSS